MVDHDRRPVFIVGHGAREAREQICVLAERLGAPVLTTFKAKGLIPDTHPLGAGVLGRSGTPLASWLMNESDLLIVIDNGSLGKISKEQLAAGVPVWHTSLHNPDWAAYAELCGTQGIRIGRREELDDAFEGLFAADGPALLCVKQDAQLL